MKKRFIISTIENKKRQKKSVHYSSSAVFFGICNEDKSLDTEVSLLNHFYLKRGITDVVATFEIYNLEGELIKKFTINMNKPKVYSLLLSKYIKKPFIGSIYVFFNSSENLAEIIKKIRFKFIIPNYQGNSVGYPFRNLHVFDNTEQHMSIYADIIK